VADEQYRTAHAVERSLHGGQVLLVGLEAVLHRDDLVTIRLQRRDHLVEARAVGPDAVAENDGWLGRCRHFAFSFFDLNAEIGHPSVGDKDLVCSTYAWKA